MKMIWKLILTVLSFVVVLVVSLCVGEIDDMLSKLFSVGGETLTETDILILREIRIPRVMMAVGVGALLSMSGLVMQSVFRNPLVEPYTMGLSGGAVLGVAIAFMLGISSAVGNIGVTLMAMLGALLTMGIILLLRRVLHYDVNKMLLSGVMISFATSSVTVLLMSLTTRENMSQIVMWNMGSLDITTKEMSYIVVIISVVMVVVLSFLGNEMNVLMVGESMARHVGVRIDIVVPLLFVLATVMAAVSVSFVGVVAFVGMIVPHVVRHIFGYDHRVITAITAIIGAIFMLMCDIVARVVIYPQEIPTGVMCGIVGGMMFIYLTAKSK